MGPMPSGPEVIIIGAGVLGASLAAVLGRDGRKVLLLERDFSIPDRIVGELLQPGGLNTLRELGLIDAVQNIDAIEEKGYIVYHGQRCVHLEYPSSALTGEQEMGVSFHHGSFVAQLRDAAENENTVECVEGYTTFPLLFIHTLSILNSHTHVLIGTVTDLLYSEDGATVLGVRYRPKTGDPIEAYAPLTVVADGCFSKFRKELVKNTAQVSSKFYG